MTRVLILIGGHLSTSPRAWKEASTLASAGNDVTVRGIWHDESLVERDQKLTQTAPFAFAPAADLRKIGVHSRFQSIWERAKGRFAKERFARTGGFSPALLGYGARAMLRAALHHRADLTIVHSEAGLWAGSELRKNGLAVGVDFEDWFSEDLLPQDRVYRPLGRLKELERELISTCSYCVTTSQAMADAMATEYAAPTPTVIYNAFPEVSDKGESFGEVRDRQRFDVPSLHWFSQTIGSGRGLELLFAALPHLSRPAEVHIRGALTPNRRAWLEALVPSGCQQQIAIHSTVPNAELPRRIAEHDIGLALEVPNCASRNLTVTNKLFQYLQTGLAIVATDTSGQREVMDKCAGAGLVVSESTPRFLAESINFLLENPAALRVAKLASARAGREMGWASQEDTLLEAFALAVSR